MAKTIFEQLGGTYTQVGDYLLPDLKLPEEEKRANIGVWGIRHKKFLRENHRVLYANLMTSGTESHRNVSPAGKRTRRKRKRNRRTQSS